MEPTYHARNALARTRLAALLECLTPQDLDQLLGGGWTVKAALAHLAFWDRFAAATMQQWQRMDFSPSGNDDAYINIAALNDWLAAPPEYVLREVTRAAEAVDRVADGISDALRAEIVAGGERWVCERGIHRCEHIEQVERSLADGPLRTPGQ